MRNIEKGCWVVVIALFCSSAAAEGVQWQATLPGAKQAATQTNRLVLIQFTANWCKYCKAMEREVFGQPQVAAALESNYVLVKVDADNFPGTVKEFGVAGLPTTVVISPEGKILAKIRGRREAGEFLTGMNQIAATVRHQRMAQRPVQPQAPPAYTPPAGSQQAVPAHRAAPDDRYADYYDRSRAVDAPVTPRYGDPALAAVDSRQGEVAPPYGNPAAPQLQNQTFTPPRYSTQQPPVGAGVPGGAASVPANQPNIADQPAKSNPPLCLDGHCPVSLIEKTGWVIGDRKWGAIHRGRTYLFVGPEEQKRFLDNPDGYAPAMSGCDVVLAVDEGRTVDGLRQHGAFFGNRVYLFVNEANLQKFESSPNRYANAVLQAMIDAGQRHYR